MYGACSPFAPKIKTYKEQKTQEGYIQTILCFGFATNQRILLIDLLAKNCTHKVDHERVRNALLSLCAATTHLHFLRLLCSMNLI